MSPHTRRLLGYARDLMARASACDIGDPIGANRLVELAKEAADISEAAVCVERERQRRLRRRIAHDTTVDGLPGPPVATSEDRPRRGSR